MATIKAYTDISQSKTLSKILPLESADMWWNGFVDEEHSIIWDGYPNFLSSDICTPCWSLAALLGVIKEQGLVDLRFLQSTYDNIGNHLTNVWCCTFENLGTISLDLYAYNPVDACVAVVEKLHELNLL